jgi:hypothetical protein
MSHTASAYRTVFELSFRYLDLIWLFLAILFFAVGLQRYRAQDAKKSRTSQRISGIFVMFLSMLCFWTATRSEIIVYLKMKRALREGNYQVAEGRVEHFVPMPYQGHAAETFDVRGVRFSYSTYDVTPCFKYTASHGGPIREGLEVRISYKATDDIRGDNCILKLETEESLR